MRNCVEVWRKNKKIKRLMLYKSDKKMKNYDKNM